MSMDTLMALFDTKCEIETERNKKSNNGNETAGADQMSASSMMSQAQSMVNSMKSGIKMPSAGSFHL